MNKQMLVVRFARPAAVIVAVLALTACASPSKPTAMIATSVAPVASGQPGHQQLRVGAVTGGAETNPMWVSKVSSEDFRTALEGTLNAAGMIAPGQAPLEVTATILDLKQPMVGLDMSVTSRVHYTVRPTSGGAAILDEDVAATGKATVGEAFVAVERLRLANEASIRANIEAFVTRLKAALAAVK